MRVKVSRIEHFNAAHKLFNKNWSREKNDLVFGPCANDNWHGHNFDLITTIEGEVDPASGFVVDFGLLSKLIKDEVINKIDHKNINLDVEFMKEKMASCENIVIEFWKILEPQISLLAPDARLYRLALHETKNNFVEYYGD